jgi:UDP-2,3-diacylglucosamine pyrophosphatase LpxH
MYSSLISKIEKAKRYAEEPQRITFQEFEVQFKGDNSSHRVSLHGDDWSCECEHFRTSGLCAHVMTLQRLFATHLTDAVKYTTEHVPA